MMKLVRCSLSTFGFEMTPAPAVQAYCYINRINRGEWVDLLIDTGASETCLHGIYALDLQEYMRDDTLEVSYGIGGIRCAYYHERATLLFRDEKSQPLSRVVMIGIQQFTEEDFNDPDNLEDCLECPSLLGRDILSRWELRYNHQKEDITLRVP